MGKNIAKYGFKSGVLPKPRQIVPKLKTFWEEAEESRINQKFNPPEMAPKGSSANPPLRKSVTGQEKIQHSAKAPSKQLEESSATDLQRWKRQAASIRRRYFVESIHGEQRLEEESVKAREHAYKREKKRQAELSNAAESEAYKLTLPTIDSMLTGPFIQPRTEEEKQLLELKREANRKATQIATLERKAEMVLELYEKAGSFIITEEDLDNCVNRNFSFNGANTGMRKSFRALNDATIDLINADREDRDKLVAELLDMTSSKGAALGTVNHALKNEQ